MSASGVPDGLDFRFGWTKRIEPVIQGHASECGVACIAMMSRYYGRAMTLVELRGLADASARGMTLGQLSRLANVIGLQTRAVRLELDELKALRLPAIAHLDGNHFVVVEQVRARKVSIVDPALGRRSVSYAELGKRFTGVALEVFPSADFSPRKRKKAKRDLTSFGKVERVRSSMLWLFLLAISLEVTVLIAPLFMQTVVDTVVANHDERLLATIAVAYLALIVCQVVISSFRSWSVGVLSASLVMGWTANVFRHLLHLPDRYFENRQLGDISSRFGSIETIQKTLSISSVEAAIDGLMAMITLAMLFAYNRTLAILVVVGMLLYTFIRLASLRTMMDSNVDLITAMAKQETAFIEYVRGVNVIRRANSQGGYTARYLDRLNEVQKFGLSLQSIQLVFNGAGTILFGGVKILTLFFGAKATIEGDFSAGMLVAFIAYVDQFTGRSTKLIDFFVGLKLLGIQFDRVADIIDSQTETALLPVFRGKIPGAGLALSGLSFRYGKDDPWILLNADAAFLGGKFTAVVGPSGTGKSTLAKLLSGQLDPLSGKITLGGVDIAHIGKRRLRGELAIVMQDDVLMSGTIAQNICGFHDEPSEERIEASARLAGVHDEIAAMPMRYDTLIGDLGALVSGGQKQRICLARALYSQPKVLVLDEGTSHLDIVNEARIMNQLVDLGLTLIVIAHRPETVGHADVVFELVGANLRKRTIEL